MPAKKKAARKPQPLDKRLAKAVDNLNALLTEAHDGGQQPVMEMTRKPGRNAMVYQVQFNGLSG